MIVLIILRFVTVWGDEEYIADCGGVAYMLARGKGEAVKKSYTGVN